MTERRTRWHELADRVFVERVETPEGLRLVFRQDDGVEAEVRELARLESECCAFATWAVAEADGEVRLDVTGKSTEGIAATHGMFLRLVRS
jgi:hypothetical protein